MKTKIYLTMIIVALFATVMALNYFENLQTVPVINTVKINTEPQTTAPPTTTATKKQSKNANMKGLWVTYMELDMSGTDRSYTEFKKKFDRIADDAVEFGFNTLIVQVRPFSDALYKSKLFPSSHILSGTQGVDCGYDALNYMCSKCHKSGLEIQAWINPYRISTNNTPSVLSTDNPYEKDKSLGKKIESGIFLNPALKKVQQLISDGVKEITDNYDIDGIQFDDYFYPTSDKSFDKTEYTNYTKAQKNKSLSLSDWRKENVNKLIRSVYKVVHSSNKNIVFGISPQGNIKNNSKIYADVKNWCSKSGYIDYICPQLYYSLDNPALAYEDAVDSWNKIKKNKNLKIYSGLAGYKAGTDSDEGTWEDFNDILSKEYKISFEKKYDGFMLYSYASMSEKSAKKEIANLKKTMNQTNSPEQ
ncbi:MAG: family 10 glycosylhydrolase [Ruminococcus sp.]|nr:family 10 glycosylhydrolase [Ruminococcus sp.]